MSGGDMVAVESEIATIEEALSTTPAKYWGDADMQSRFLDLLTARETGRPPAPVPAAWKERKRLQALMADENSEYWKGPKAAENQAYYLRLLGASEEPGLVLGLNYTANPDAPPKAVESAAEIMRALSVWDQASLVEAFDFALPEAVQRAAITELAAGPPRVAPVASAADLERFQTDEDNAALARAWGARAAACLGTYRARLRRILGGLSASDRRQAIHWLNSAPPKEYAAIVRQLAGA
ncbi:hypothetical protein [Reyranella sp.]|jgi:hypothetical protein|uniref:hypothetical protein n=1 Tax=Reyranella sp. TaxID=1929291 RepID=UPI000BC49BBF|nr:hypothetical protein [Reyranella sp.]OYY46068.1 MAG: hypothetical protein B7Y57_04230 [Rhodospirillales bacterium 35-66-84]OYZ96448.1 MAG: hypothetical protein B7Y08_04590 [Rhodospirillales bacterium 24-66-33]OZB28389.1 MAG: hypothetical protein B7X63_00555 [Rhodospirillales bacterium 39-66-50]HQS14402.1 hypothetical protein [Reyranella sp.]HQT11399.1 hypothetical protein [Reyranella sp.]